MPSGLPATALASVGALNGGGEVCGVGLGGSRAGLKEGGGVEEGGSKGDGGLGVEKGGGVKGLGGVKGGGGGGLIFGKSLSKSSISFGASKKGF